MRQCAGALCVYRVFSPICLLYPAGELSFEQIEAAVLNVARYDVFKLGEAVLVPATFVLAWLAGFTQRERAAQASRGPRASPST